jgi:hypothetical protein
MKISRMLAAAACAVALLGTAPAAFAQRASGGGPSAGFVGGPAHFSRPYYAFQPHWNLGFGLWAGDPFAYPDAFYSPFFYYPNGSSYSDDSAFPHYPGNFPSSDDTAPTYSTSWSSLVQPDQTNLGGMSFDVTPATAELFVDNMRVGTVGQFTPTTQPVGLPAGYHHVEIRMPGHHPMSFDVEIAAGEVTPFQGTMVDARADGF